MKRLVSGFTLIEILVVVTILSILSAVLYSNFNEAKQQSRDTERQGDLRTMQTAIELFKNDHGHYPSGCNASGTWSGQPGSGGAYCTSGSSAYIVNLAPKYIPALPMDPKLNPAVYTSGYMYTVDPEGMVYKLMALQTVEADTVSHSNTDTHEFYRCVSSVNLGASECSKVPSTPLGNSAYNTSGPTPGVCNTPFHFAKVYAVVGGYANGGMWGGSYISTEKAREYFSDIIRCK